MRVWRLVRRPYADLSGIGAASYPGRWNAARQRVVYTAEHPALAVLEVRVHLGLDLDLIPPDYVLMAIELGRSPIETYTGPAQAAPPKFSAPPGCVSSEPPSCPCHRSWCPTPETT